jgi:hypothetical protein
MIAAAGLVLLVAGAVPSEASTVSATFTGHITDLNFGDVVAGAPNINVNDPFQITYSYDTTAPVIATMTSSVGGVGKEYRGGSFTLTIGGSQVAFGQSRVDVWDYPDTTDIADSFQVWSFNPEGSGSANIPGWSLDALFLDFYFLNTTFTSTNLPLNSLDAANDIGDYLQLTLNPVGGGDSYYIFGSIKPAVATTPIPATLPLFASALGGLGFAGWKRRKGATAVVR